MSNILHINRHAEATAYTHQSKSNLQINLGYLITNFIRYLYELPYLRQSYIIKGM